MSEDCISKEIHLPCGATLKNRIAKAALSESLCDPKTSSPHEGFVKVYSRWASTNAGLLLTGNIMIDRRYKETPRNTVVEDERDLEILTRWASETQKNGVTALWAQINHPGRQSPRSVTSQPVAPSAVPAVNPGVPAFAKPRALTIDEIHEIVQRFARTSQVLQKAGFQGVQIHAAHGYLLSQFLSPNTNTRTDEYGGSLENRRRILFEVYNAVREAVGPNFPVGFKLNSSDFQKGGLTTDESLEIIQLLEEAGVDLLEISGGNYESTAMFGSLSTQKREAYFLEFAQKAKEKLTKMPLMVTGGFRTRETMENALRSNSLDVIGLGRPFCVEPVEVLRGLLDGTTTELVDVQVTTGVKMLDAGVSSIWHAGQIHRIAQDMEPDKKMGVMSYALFSPIKVYFSDSCTIL